MLIAFLVALGLTMPAGVRAMPMPATMIGMAMTVDQPCQRCPQPGSTTPGKVPACQAMACISVPAVLPSPVLLPARVLFGPTYASPLTAGMAGAEPTPDPFPPRPIILL